MIPNELDALDRKMAEKCMGWFLCETGSHFESPSWKCWESGEHHPEFAYDNWHPTRDIGQAFMCLEKLDWWELRTSTSDYYCRVSGRDIVRDELFFGKSNGDTPALAICLAIEKWLEGK